MSDIDNLQWWVHVANAGAILTIALSLLFAILSFVWNKRLGEMKDADAALTQQTAAARIAEVDLKREATERELREVQDGLKYRTLSNEQRLSLLTRLELCPKIEDEIDIIYAGNDLESQNFAKILRSVLRESGQNTEMTGILPMTYDFKGLRVETPSVDNPVASCLHRALTEVGIPAPGHLNPDTTKISLIVGEKP